MQPIPQKINNVSVYPYVDVPHILAKPVLEGASGTWSFGTLGLSVFYNAELQGGTATGTLAVHGSYFCRGECEDGSSFASPWMYCLDASQRPHFGRTVTVGRQDGSAGDPGTGALAVPPYNVLAPLTNVTVSQLFPPPAIGQLGLIANATGNVIATKVGTPHEMGVQVTGGTRSQLLHTGMTRIIITGKTKDGHTFSTSNLTALAVGDPAVFLRVF